MRALARWLTDTAVPTRTGKRQWERSTIWGMLRNPAYQGTACFAKTGPVSQRKVTRRLRLRGGLPTRPCLRPRRREEWIEIPVPALISSTQYALAQERLHENRRFAARHTKVPSLLQGLLVCRACGYAYYRTSTRTSRGKRSYYRCLGSDDYRYPEGRRCTNRPVRQDALDTLVWDEVIRLLANPSRVRQEIDRRLAALRTEQPVTAKRESLVKTLARIRGAMARLVEAYQEELVSLEELRARMPPLRQREATTVTQLTALEAELTDAETYVALAESLEGFLDKLHQAAQTLDIADRQRVVRLLLKEVLVGPGTLVLGIPSLSRVIDPIPVIYCAGGVISPLLSNIYLTEVDAMLERAKEVTRNGRFTYVEYARYADDLVILVNGQWRDGWLLGAVDRRLREEFAKLDVRLNETKSRVVDLTQGEAFGFLGFTFRRLRSPRGRWWVQKLPAMKQRTALLRKLGEVFWRWRSQPVEQVIAVINPILRGWVNYFRVGNAARCFGFVKEWVERKVRRHMMRARGRRGFGWKRWSTAWIYRVLGVFHDYRVQYQVRA